MRRTLLTVVAALATFPALQAQDLITKRSGEKVEAKVVEVSTSEIKYKRFSYQDGPTYILPKSEIMLITYEDKTSEVFELEDYQGGTGAASTSPTFASQDKGYAPVSDLSSMELYAKGQADAKQYYAGYKAAGTGTLVLSVISPVAGLIPAGITSAIPPKKHNWDAPINQLSQDPDYKSGYKKAARKKKAAKIWLNWGIGMGVNVLLGAALLAK